MKREIFSSQELYCHLKDYVLVNPKTDDWKSLKGTTSVFFDCWRVHAVYKVLGDSMEVFDGDEKIARLEYHENEYFNLTIEFLNAEGFEEDTYPFIELAE